MKHRKLETTPEISKRMANVSLKGGKAEEAMAKALWAKGIRYRKNYRKLPGSPDIAITKYKVAVFVDGEFWHGEDWENRKGRLKSNRDYWIEKIEENIAKNELEMLDYYVSTKEIIVDGHILSIENNFKVKLINEKGKRLWHIKRP